MKRIALFLLVLFGATPAWAEELRVVITMATGQDQVRYTLSEDNTRLFWQKWRGLALTSSIVPVPGGNTSYKGLTVYPSEGGDEVRIFNGLASRSEHARVDEYRQLERWVLGFAPPPLGPALVRALDEEVATAPGAATQARPTDYRSGEQIVASCFQRARNDARRRALCIHEQLLQRLPPAEYAKALGNMALQALPPKTGTTTR